MQIAELLEARYIADLSSGRFLLPVKAAWI